MQAIDCEWLSLKCWLPKQLHRKAPTFQGSVVNVRLKPKTNRFLEVARRNLARVKRPLAETFPVEPRYKLVPERVVYFHGISALDASSLRAPQ